MTVTLPPPADVAPRAPEDDGTRPALHARSSTAGDAGPTPRRLISLALIWVAIAVGSIGIVLYGLTGSFAQREQRTLFQDYRVELEQSANEALTIAGATVPTRAPEFGTPVGVVEIGGMRVQQVAVEGATTAQTDVGIAHVPGTAGLGEPGNAVLVARRALYGAPFADLSALHKGERILVTTKHGQSVYAVESVGDHSIDDATVAAARNDDLYGAAAGAKDPLAANTIHAEDLYGPSKDDRLTLVTSANAWPLNSSSATVVVAKLEGHPFAPTPQNGRTDSQSGRTGDSAAWAPMLLAILFYAGAVAMAVFFYRGASPRVAYVLTVAPILVATIVIAETASRLLPAWT